MKIPSFLLLALLTLSACNDAQGESGGASSAELRWLMTTVGRVDSAEEARQLVASVDGVIEKVFVERGQMVSKGEALLEVACKPRDAMVSTQIASVRQAQAAAISVEAGARVEAIEAAEASMSLAESQLREKDQQLQQAAALIEKGFVSKREVEARNNARDGAFAELNMARARLAELRNGARASDVKAAFAEADGAVGAMKMAQAQAEQCSLRSPISGQVLQILRQEGEFSGASQGTPLIIVGDMSQLIVRAEVNERDAGRIKIGQNAEIWIDGQAKRWPGKVVQLASVMGRRSARSLDPTDRFDRDVREAFIAFTGENPPALVGLRVTVGIKK